MKILYAVILLVAILVDLTVQQNETATTAIVTSTVSPVAVTTGMIMPSEDSGDSGPAGNATTEKAITSEGAASHATTETRAETDTISCYVCSSEEDDTCASESTPPNVEDCEGNCWVTIFRKDEESFENVTRTCSADPCSDMHEDGFSCQTATGLEMCTYCCTSDQCNTAASLTYSSCLAILLAAISGMHILG